MSGTAWLPTILDSLSGGPTLFKPVPLPRHIDFAKLTTTPTHEFLVDETLDSMRVVDYNQRGKQCMGDTPSRIYRNVVLHWMYFLHCSYCIHVRRRINERTAQAFEPQA